MTINISLDIRAWPSSGSDGYTNTKTNDDKTYCYKWTGGTDGEGNVVEHLKTGVDTIMITSVADRRFVMIGTEMSPGNTQFTLTKTSGYQATITDIGTVKEDDYFKLQFQNTIPGYNNSTFWCDPRVKNDD